LVHAETKLFPLSIRLLLPSPQFQATLFVQKKYEFNIIHNTASCIYDILTKVSDMD